METQPEQTDKTDVAKHAPAPKEYATPRLVNYGSVASLTQSTGSANGDGGQNMMT